MPTPTLAPWYTKYAKRADRILDFTALQERNPAIYAWITVPGTKIDYPIVHAIKNDITYLTNDAFLEKNENGAIFTDGWNNPDFSDRLTIAYGHNMKDGGMFANLRYFRDAKFFNAHDTITIYMDGVQLTYKIFAAYIADDTHILAYNDLDDDAVFKAYIDSIFERRDFTANFREVELTENDRIITLSTCTSQDDKRVFVQGVLTKNE